MKNEKAEKANHSTLNSLQTLILRTITLLIFTFSLLICMACAGTCGSRARYK